MATTNYDLWHDSHDRPEFELRFPWHKTVARLLPDLDGKTVLELGCGRGDFSAWLSRKFPRAKITGVDFSQRAIEIACRYGHQVRFLVGDAQEVPLPSAHFDWVISCECMEHVLEPRKMASEIARLLKPSGCFILTTENYFNGMLVAWLRSWITGKPFDSGSGIQPHENFFLYWRVRQMLESTGLHVEAMESNHFQWLLLPGIDPAKLCTEELPHRFIRGLFRPFGRHFTFMGTTAPCIRM